jgi:hypothetical protein
MYDLFRKKRKEKGAKASTMSDGSRIQSSPRNSYALKISYFKKLPAIFLWLLYCLQRIYVPCESASIGEAPI